MRYSRVENSWLISLWVLALILALINKFEAKLFGVNPFEFLMRNFLLTCVFVPSLLILIYGLINMFYKKDKKIGQK